MPRITVKLPSNYENISRPVAVVMARDVMRICGIDEKTPLMMPGEFEQIGQSANQMGNDGEVGFNGQSRIRVTAKDLLRNESVMQQVIRQNEMPPMLVDDRLGISVRPVYMQSDIELSFQNTFASRMEAIQWRDEFAARRAENRTSVQHQIEYSIPMHENVMGLLAHLHELREKQAGYGESFVEYFKSMQRRPMHLLGTQDGDINKSTIVIPEQQIQVVGYFNFTEIPVEEKTSNNSTWTIEFNYRAMYHRCTHLYVTYPTMVHQQWISAKLFDRTPYYVIDELPKMGALGIKALEVIGGNVDSFPPPADGIRFPAFDEWIPGWKAQPPYSVPAITWLLKLNPSDPQALLNLTQLPKIMFTLEMDTYLRSIYKTLHRKGGGVCFLTLYANDLPMDESALVIDEHLNVRATIPLDIRKSYHLRLSFPTWYTLFTETALRGMQTQPLATIQAFKSIMPSLNVDFAMEALIDGEVMTRAYIQWFYRHIQDKGIGFEGGNNGGGGPGGQIGPGEAGGTPGIDVPGGGSGGGGGSDGSSPDPDDWGPGNHWQRDTMGGSRYVQFLSIAALRKT